MLVTVEDQNGSKFGASSVRDAITRCRKYAEYPSDVFRVYVVDADNPYPGYLAAWVTASETTVYGDK